MDSVENDVRNVARKTMQEMEDEWQMGGDSVSSASGYGADQEFAYGGLADLEREVLEELSRDLDEAVPMPPMDAHMRSDLFEYWRLTERAPRIGEAGEFLSLAESIRDHKQGLDITPHLERLFRSDRTYVLTALRRLQRADGSQGVAKKRATPTRAHAPRVPSPPVAPKEYVVYPSGKPRVVKPRTFAPAAFRAWVDGEASHNARCAPGSVSVLNGAGVALLGRGDLTKRRRAELLASARVELMSWSELKATGGSVSALRSHIEAGPLVLETSQDLERVAGYFTRHKPLYRTCQAYFAAPTSVDVGRLAAQLRDKVFRGPLAQEAAELLSAPVVRAGAGQVPFEYDPEGFPALRDARVEAAQLRLQELSRANEDFLSEMLGGLPCDPTSGPFVARPPTPPRDFEGPTEEDWARALEALSGDFSHLTTQERLDFHLGASGAFGGFDCAADVEFQSRPRVWGRVAEFADSWDEAQAMRSVRICDFVLMDEAEIRALSGFFAPDEGWLVNAAVAYLGECDVLGKELLEEDLGRVFHHLSHPRLVLAVLTALWSSPRYPRGACGGYLAHLRRTEGLPRHRVGMRRYLETLPPRPPGARRVRYQGNGSSSMVRQCTEEAVDTALHTVEATGAVDRIGHSLGAGFVRGARDQLPQVAESAIRPILNTLLGLVNLANANSPALVVGIAMQTLINDPIAMGYAQGLFSQVDRQGSVGDEAAAMPWWGKVAGLTVFSALREFFGELYAALVPSFLEVCGALKFASLKAFAAGVADAIANALGELLQRVKACWREGSLHPLMGVDAERWCRHTLGIMAHKDYVLSHGDAKLFRQLAATDELPLAIRRHMTKEELVEVLEAHYAEGERLVPLLPKEKRLVLEGLLRRITSYKSQLQYTIAGSTRRLTPYALLIFGAPGTGKSVDAEELTQRILRREGRSSTDAYYFRDENFRTGLQPGTFAVRMDDPDAVPQPPSAGYENYCEFLQRIVNTTPYSVEAASVEDKGKHFARPSYVIATSNFSDFKATSKTFEPTAIWRRFQMWIEVEVKPEYAGPNGMLDLTLGDAIPPNPRLYTLSKYKGTSGGTLQRRTVAHKVEWSTMVRILDEDMERFMALQTNMMQRTEGVCEHCDFSLDRCVCSGGPDRRCEACGHWVCLCPRVGAWTEPLGVAGGVTLQGNVSAGYRRTGSMGAFGHESSHFEADWRDSVAAVRDYFRSTQGIGVLLLGVGALGTAALVVQLFTTMAENQGREMGLTNPEWWRLKQDHPAMLPKAPPATWSYEQMEQAVRENLCFVKGSDQEMQGVIYKPGWVLFPTHVFGPDGLAEIHFRGRVEKFRRDQTKLLLNAEFSVVWISAFSGINGIRTYVDPHISNAHALSRVRLVGMADTYALTHGKTSTHLGQRTWIYDPVTKSGDCGSLLLGVGPGESPRIFGMHLMCKAGSWSASGQISQDQIDGVIARADPVRSLFPQTQVAQQGAPKFGGEITHYPPISEINVARSYYRTSALEWGSMRIPGRTARTQFKPTSFHDQVKQFALQEGVFCDYGPPEFRGRMVDGVYESPYTHALKDTNLSPTEYMDCVDEYVGELGGHWGPPLSEQEAVQGVPGQFNSINLRTSMGPFTYGPKTNWIDREHGEIHPAVQAQLDEYMDILASGVVPQIFVDATLKDEILKVGKKARVFCMLPAAFNILCKRYFAPLKRAMRSSYFASSCCVGLDFGSRACEDYVESLLVYKHLYDLDISRMDKCWTPQLWDAVAEVVRKITAQEAGEETAWIAWALIQSLKTSIIVLKGDFFTLFWNPSGNDITVELNSIAMCLMLIKVCRVTGVTLFRTTYGDDTNGATNELLPDDFFDRFRAITGFDATDGRKMGRPTAGGIEDITFLKRTFRYDAEYGCWCAPLELSSVVKMLLFRGKSTLSPLDHERELVQAASRYLVLHGRDTFGRWNALLARILPDASLQTYDDAMEHYRAGRFSDWMDRTAVHDGAAGGPASGPPRTVVDAGPVYEGNPVVTTLTNSISAMNSNSNATANEPNVPLGTPSTSALAAGLGAGTAVPVITADASKVVSTADTQVQPAADRFAALSALAPYPLDDFPTRWVQIDATVLSVANNPLAWGVGVVDTIRPYNSLLGNAALANKTRNWKYFRGSIEVMASVALPGNASGAYGICAVPYATQAEVIGSGSLEGFNEEDVLGYEHSAIITAASASNVVLDLPYWSVYDANEVANPDMAGGWMIYVVCLSPLRTSVSSGVTTGKITWYARFKPGYEFLVPRWQGRKKSIREVAGAMREDKAVSRAASAVKSVADHLVGVPMLGPVASMVSAGAGTVAAVADFFGFSRPNEEPSRALTFSTSVGNVALTDGTDACQTSGFSMRNQISLDPVLTGGDAADPLSIESVSQRWKCIKGFEWTSAHITGTTLATVYISPGYGMGNADNLAVPGAGYCGLPFDYWRATAEYLVIVPASALHRGSLQMVYIPWGDTAPGGTDAVTNVGMNAVMDVSSASAFQFDVGFANNKPMLPLWYFNDTWAILPSGTGNGSLQIRVVNPLVSANPTDSINVQIFVRFRDVQFAVPRSAITWPDSVSGTNIFPWEDGVSLQGRTTGATADTEDDGIVEEFSLVPSDGPYPVMEVVSGEEVKSLRALAQRPSRLILGDVNVSMLCLGGMGGFGVGSSTRLTTAGMALAPFITAAASQKVRVIPQLDTWVGCASLRTDITFPDSAKDYVPPHMPMTYTGPQRGAEFKIPYYYPARSRSSRRTTFSTTWTNADLQAQGQVVVLNVRGTTPKFRAYYSLGDDMRVGPFLRIPRLRFRQTAASFPGWFT